MFAASAPVWITGIVCLAPFTAEPASDDVAAVDVPTDAAVALAVEDRIRRDPTLRLAPLRVDARVGVVTIAGEVHHLLARERAAELAATVRGVRSIVNRIVVDPHEERTDEEIAEAIRRALLVDGATEAFDVDVEALDGIATLTGIVQSPAERTLSLRVARTVPGVTDVIDRITVERDAVRPGRELATELESVLRNDAWIHAEAIDVLAEDDAVRLTGRVPSLSAKARVERLARTRIGADRVDVSGLEVDPSAADPMSRDASDVEATPDEIERAVSDAFLFDPRVAASEIEVTARGDVAYLRGTVDTLAARRAAERVALDTLGVRRVKNHLVVTPRREVSDDDLRARLDLAFSADPWLRDEPVDAEVARGIVRLEGTVGSDAVRRRAAAVAARVGGVRLVDDRLALRTRTGTVPRDADLEEDVESELYWSPFVDSRGIEVDVLDGVVTLRGVARSWAEIRAAERNAEEAGARHVRNRLTVEHAPTREPGRAPLDEG